MNRFRIILLAMLAVHLLAVNTNLLINLTTYFKADKMEFQVAFAVLFSLSYSLGNVYTLNRKGLVWLKVMFALLDGSAMILWYNTTIKGNDYIYLTSSFYAIYTIMIALGVGIRDKVRKSKFEGGNYNFLKLFAYGYILYLKGKFRKSKNPKLLNIANDFELLLGNFEVDFDKETVTNLKEVKNELTKIIKK